MRKRSRIKPKAKKTSTREPARDENQMAYDLIQQLDKLSVGMGGKNPMAVALGRLGGLKGGRARAAIMTPSERSKSAKKAAQARWARKTKT
jgi:hypothetical protein